MNNEDLAKTLEKMSLFSQFAQEFGGGGLFSNKYLKELVEATSAIDAIAGAADLTGYYSIEGDNSLEDIRRNINSHKTVKVTKSFAEFLLDKDPEIFDEKELIIVEG